MRIDVRQVIRIEWPNMVASTRVALMRVRNTTGRARCEHRALVITM